MTKDSFLLSKMILAAYAATAAAIYLTGRWWLVVPVTGAVAVVVMAYHSLNHPADNPKGRKR